MAPVFGQVCGAGIGRWGSRCTLAAGCCHARVLQAPTAALLCLLRPFSMSPACPLHTTACNIRCTPVWLHGEKNRVASSQQHDPKLCHSDLCCLSHWVPAFCYCAYFVHHCCPHCKQPSVCLEPNCDAGTCRICSMWSIQTSLSKDERSDSSADLASGVQAVQRRAG